MAEQPMIPARAADRGASVETVLWAQFFFGVITGLCVALAAVAFVLLYWVLFTELVDVPFLGSATVTVKTNRLVGVHAYIAGVTAVALPALAALWAYRAAERRGQYVLLVGVLIGLLLGALPLAFVLLTTLGRG